MLPRTNLLSAPAVIHQPDVVRHHLIREIRVQLGMGIAGSQVQPRVLRITSDLPFSDILSQRRAGVVHCTVQSTPISRC